MNLEQAKKIFRDYSFAWDKSIRAKYTLATPLSFLQNSIEEIKQAIKVICTNVIYTTKVTENELEILKISYQNLATFISDADAKVISVLQKLLQEGKDINGNEFKDFLVENKGSLINNLEAFIKTQKSIQQEMERLAVEFENFSTSHHPASSDDARKRGQKIGRKLGYNIGMLYYSVIRKIKGEK